MYIQRKLQHQLKEYRNYKAAILTGPRQAGKTTLLRMALPDHEYISLDDPAAAIAAEQNPLQFLESLDLPAIIDEVQYAPELLRAVKTFVDGKDKKGLIFLSGSQNFSIMEQAAESLAGRTALFQLNTLSCRELLDSGKFGSGRKLAELHLLRGGYPALYENPGMDAAFWYSSYLGTYLERDVRTLAGVGNLRQFRTFLRAAALRSGQLLNFTDLARDTGIAPNTARSWISVLIASGIVDLLEPYHGNLNKRLVKSPKLYFLDTGLLAYLLEITEYGELLKSPLLGQVFESYIYGQLYRLRSESRGTFSVHFFQDKTGREIDFLITKGSLRIGIEAKCKEKPNTADAWNFNSFEKLAGTLDAKYIAAWNSRRYTIADGPVALPVWRIEEALAI